jgi:hypothetical protein
MPRSRRNVTPGVSLGSFHDVWKAVTSESSVQPFALVCTAESPATAASVFEIEAA